MTFRVAVARPVHFFGKVTLGSIVEGTDVTPTPASLSFPFDTADLHHNIKELEAEVGSIWLNIGEEENE